MKRVSVWAVVAALTTSSYAWAQAPEAWLGQAVPAGGKPAKGRAPEAAKSMADGAPVTRFGRALAGLQPDGRAATRGAKEVRVYQEAAPAVVLVVAEGGFGSGALVSADGLIVTNLHVVGDAAEVGVIFKPRTEGVAVADAAVRRGKVVRRDEVADLALIQVAEVPEHVKPLAMGDAASVQVGADVHAIGHPTGEAWTYTRGIVSQIRRDYEWSTEDKIPRKATVIQTQTPINPGNSGGPLIDDGLRLIGINSFIGDGEGLNYAVSVEEVRALLARKEDRLVSAQAKAAASKPCEDEVLDEKRNEEDKTTRFVMDSDCDGGGDYVVVVADDKRQPLLVMLDDDGDGKLDTVIVDKDHDGKPEQAFYDTDGDGKSDLEGKFRRGETEPYRYDRIKR